MEEKEFAHKFPEWVLSYSLSEAYDKGDKQEFWKRFWEIQVHPTNEPGNPKKFSDLHPSLLKAPMLSCDTPFKRDDADRYGIQWEIYKNKFWFLRPDFVIENEERALIVLLDAKSGEQASKIYKTPKEKLYYDFLLESKAFPWKGFYYIIPKNHVEFCSPLLAEHFRPQPQQMLQTGFILWEDPNLLAIIYPKVLETVVDEVSKEMNGLQELRKWYRSNR